MRFDRLDKLVLLVLAGLGLVLIAMLAIGPRAGLLVAGTAPPDGGQVGGRARLGITFTETMDAASVEARLRFEPALAGQFRWQGAQMWFLPDQALEPGQSYQAILEPGAETRRGLAIGESLQWTFHVRQPWLTYLAPVSGPVELWRVAGNVAQGQAERISDSGGQIFDYAIAADGEQITYTQANAQGGLDLWLMGRDGSEPRVLVDCGRDRCSLPSWSPDGARIAYSREEAPPVEPRIPGPPRIWTVEVPSGQTATLFQDSQILGHSPSWSPDGARLAFFDTNAQGIRVLLVESGRQEVLPSEMGLVGSWSPGGEQMLFNVLAFIGESPTSALYRADFRSQELGLAFAPDLVQGDFGPPLWSPDGEWVLVGLQRPETGPGRQLWLLRPDGSEARPLVEDPDYSHGGYQWSPAGDSIVFQRVRLGTALARPEVLTIDLASEALTLLAEDAWLPAWLP